MFFPLHYIASPICDRGYGINGLVAEKSYGKSPDDTRFASVHEVKRYGIFPDLFVLSISRRADALLGRKKLCLEAGYNIT